MARWGLVELDFWDEESAMPFSLDAPAAVLPVTLDLAIADLITTFANEAAAAVIHIGPSPTIHIGPALTKDAVSIGDTFALELLHNQLNLAELQSLVTSTTSALNPNITSLARNVKG
jgi:hypothetical protein